MARIKGALNARKKHNRVLKLAKGYRGARSKQYRIAKQSVMRALTSAFAGRKQKKRDEIPLDRSYQRSSKNERPTYSQLMHGLKVAGDEINRKMLAELAVNDAAGFAALVDVGKKAVAQFIITTELGQNNEKADALMERQSFFVRSAGKRISYLYEDAPCRSMVNPIVTPSPLVRPPPDFLLVRGRNKRVTEIGMCD